ncbi:MAG: helix-turn-helix domain-containing protein [Rhodocyclaceae bacterium]|nr:helix-turn-helix domain-containing protein [Rhodocyclaceae bacterium]
MKSNTTNSVPLHLPAHPVPSVEAFAYRWLAVKPNIAKRFTYERHRLNLTRARIAETMERGNDTVARYEKGGAIPLRDFIKLIDLGVDIGYILSGEHKHAAQQHIYRAPTMEPYQRLKTERERLRLMASEIASQMGCDTWTLRAYERGDVGISTDTLEKLYNAGYDCHFLLAGERHQEKLQAAIAVDHVKSMLERVVPIDDKNRRIATVNEEWRSMQKQARLATFGTHTQPAPEIATGEAN